MLRNNLATLQLMEIMKQTFTAKEAMALVAKGGDPNIKIAKGFTLLHNLIIDDNDKSKNYEYIIELIETYRAKVNITDDLGLTPFYYLISRNCFRLDIAMKLIENGANPNTLNSNGKSLLHKLIRKKITEVAKKAVKELIQVYHADIEIRDNDGNTSIEYLLKKQNYKWAIFLIQLGGNPITRKQLNPSLIEIFVKTKNEQACHTLQNCMVQYGYFNREKINQYRTDFLNFLFVLAQSFEGRSNGLFSTLPLEIIFIIISHFNFTEINTTREAGLQLTHKVLNEYQNIKPMLKTSGGVNVMQSKHECKFFKSVNTLREDYTKLRKKESIACFFAKLTGKNTI